MADPTAQADLLVQTQLRFFLQRVFKTLNPQTELKQNWHHDYLCWNLQRTLPTAPVMIQEVPITLNPTPEDRIFNLLVNEPPRSLKSELISVAYPAFLLGNWPHEQYIGASYSGRLSDRMASKTRHIMHSDWYREMFPGTELVKETDALTTTSQMGHRIATSVGGTVTGEGGNFLVGDDLLNPGEASSDTSRDGANEFWDETYCSRANDDATCVKIIVMQRLHALDLTGHVLKKNKELPADRQWKHVCLPSVAPETKTYHYYNKSHTWKKGEPLQIKRQGHKFLKIKKVELGTYAYAGQFLQTPSPPGGGMVKLKWFRTYDKLPEGEPNRIVASWDTGFKETKTSHPSACTVWGEYAEGYFLLFVFAEKLEYPDLKRKIIEIHNMWNCNVTIIEDKASGQSLIQDLQKPGDNKIAVIAFKPGDKDKVSRMGAETPTIEAGRVWIPTEAHWLEDYLEEMALFPNAANDDQADSTSQGIHYLRTTNVFQYRIRTL